MVLKNSQFEKLIYNLEKVKNYLEEKSKLEPSYTKLIKIINQQINVIKHNDKPTVKLIGFSPALLSKFKTLAEADSGLRSHCYFKTILKLNNISEVLSCCSVFFLVYQSNQKIPKNHRQLIKLAQKKNISIFILVKQHQSDSSHSSLSAWIKSQNYLANDSCISPIDDFFDLNNSQHIQLYQQILCDRLEISNKELIQKHSQNITKEIEKFFEDCKTENWRKIKQIKKKYLQDREIHNYQQQILIKTFNKIDRQQQQTILALKQKINQSRSNYLNPFVPDSWMFNLQKNVEQTKIKLVKENRETYIYLTIKNNEHIEYFHSYILNRYQQQISDVLSSQWMTITAVKEENILSDFVRKTNNKIKQINLLQDSNIKLLKTEFNSKLSPQLDLATIVDPYCLKVNSRIVFEHNYTQSNWFKLLVSILIGSSIYIITKLFFGEGRYIGFFILIFQIINIITGQSIKKIKLKNYHRELQRAITNKYQVLIRLIAEQLTQSLITSIDSINKQYRQNLDAISDLAQNKLDKIKQDIDWYQLQNKHLEQDKTIIKSWLD